MKDEIKEILESSRKIIKSNRENGFDRIIMLGDDIDKLLDYITNLQEENEKNKEYSEFYNDMSNKWKDMSDMFKKSYEDYKSRNEKAIEYITKNTEYDEEHTYYKDFFHPLLEVTDVAVEDIIAILNILQGSDKEC